MRRKGEVQIVDDTLHRIELLLKKIFLSDGYETVQVSEGHFELRMSGAGKAILRDERGDVLACLVNDQPQSRWLEFSSVAGKGKRTQPCSSLTLGRVQSTRFENNQSFGRDARMSNHGRNE